MATATAEEGGLAVWPALEPNSSSSNHVAAGPKGMNKLKLWSEPFPARPAPELNVKCSRRSAPSLGKAQS